MPLWATNWLCVSLAHSDLFSCITQCNNTACTTGQELCPEGSDDDGECKACSPGTSGTTNYTCELCPIGTYQDRNGSTACSTCPSDDMVTDSVGSESPSDCKCRAGFSHATGKSLLLAGGGANASFDGFGSDARYSFPT
jgi:hypothetical protein